jgi:hypothetical protein
VLTVEASNATALLAAVRSVDPEGRYAMAVAAIPGTRTQDRVIAVDTTRYARVGRMPDGMPSPGELAPLLRPPAPQPPTVTEGPLVLEVAVPEHPTDEPGSDGPAPPGAPDAVPGPGLRVHLSTVDGMPVSVEYADLVPGRQIVEAAVDGCVPSCRLVSVEVVPPPGAGAAPVTVDLYEIRQSAGTVVSGRVLGDITRWRTTLISRTIPVVMKAAPDHLSVTMPASLRQGWVVNAQVMPMTAPVPVPVVFAGPPLEQRGGDARISALGGSDVPFEVVATVVALPRVADRGVLADLEYALRSNDAGTEAVDLFVWLTADAPGSLVAALADHGVTVRGDASVADRTDELAGYGPGLALRFEYFAVVVVLVLAGGVAVVGATVERSERVAELVALRGQGLSARAARAAGYTGTAVLVTGAVATGVVAALLAQVVVSAGLPIFSDDWQVLPVPAGLTPVTLLVSVAVTLVVIGLAALWGAARLVAAVSAGTADPSRAVVKPGDRADRTGDAP